MDETKMENPTVTVDCQRHKSNAPWILGLIAFCISIPNVICATLCAAVATGVTAAGVAASAQADGATNAQANEQAEAAIAAAGAGMAGWFIAIVLASIICFILSFFGKSQYSLTTGVVMILGGAFIMVNGFIGFGSILWGTTAGLLYIIAGGLSISNHKLPA